jgi:hypothetical protein
LACIPIYGDRGRDFCCNPAGSQESAPQMRLGRELAVRTRRAASMSPQPRFIFSSMDRAITTRACAIAWLLCAVLTCLAVHSPHCDLCDGPYFVTSSSHQPRVNQPLPAAPDTCNGICSCCGFRGLPNVGPVLDLVNTVVASVCPESPSPVLAPRSPIFRPPRIAVSS